MNGFLLDTHTLLWWIDADERLGRQARAAIESTHRVLVSDVSLWECAIKVSTGKFEAVPDVLTWFDRHVAEQRFASLAIDKRHLAGVAALPLHHRDPFDRLLVSQARIEGFAVLTDDATISEYGVETVW